MNKITSPYQEDTHAILRLEFEHDDLGSIRSYEHGKSIKEMKFGETFPGVSVDAWALNDPIVVYRRRLHDEVKILDGTIRALYAYENGLTIPADFHICFCLTSYLEPFQLCKTALPIWRKKVKLNKALL